MKKVFAVFSIVLVFSAVRAQTSAVAHDSALLDPAAIIKDVEKLSADAMQGRGVGTEGGESARQYVAARFKESGIKPFDGGYLQPFEFTSRGGAKISAANVVGFIEGTKFKNKFIVVSAHYDHLGVQKGEIYNGADDNASGTAALFAIGRYFAQNQPSHSLIFAAFDAEESGLRGSRKFVELPPVPNENLVLNVNMDMISRSKKNELYAAGTYHYPDLKSMIEKTAKSARVKLLIGHDRPEQKHDDWTFQSDHAAFHQAKIPFVYFGVEDHEDYHKPTDDFERIDRDFFINAVETIIQAVKAFDKDLR